MSDISQLASRVGGGERGSVANSPHITTLTGSLKYLHKCFLAFKILFSGGKPFLSDSLNLSKLKSLTYGTSTNILFYVFFAVNPPSE